MLPLRGETILAPNELANVFMNIESIYDENGKLLKSLEACGDEWPFVSGVGTQFTNIVWQECIHIHIHIVID
jgi:hypothetical protein